MPNYKSIFYGIALVTIIILWFYYIRPTLKVATGYAAKYMCSYTFLSNMSEKNTLKALDFFPVNSVKYQIDKKNKQVETSFLGFIAKQKATFYQYGKHCGCVLGEVDYPESDIEITQNSREVERQKQLLWPQGDQLKDEIPAYFDVVKISQVLDNTLKNNPQTYAIVVAYKDFLLAEKYNTGVKKDTRILGWSMTKTISSSLLGIMQKNNIIDIQQPAGFDEWNQDNRQPITTHNLLQMSSGLDWTEDYTKLSSVTQMLYLEKDMTAYPTASSLKHSPNDQWLYSSGTTNLLSKIIRDHSPSFNDYLNFPYKDLFHQIGMHSAIIETDNVGNFVFSSYCWATARDWTRFGLLYLNEGNWFGKQIFSPEWVKYSITPADNSNGIYGAQMWLNASGEKIPPVPKDAYYENGFGGQRILIIPSMDMVITVMSGNQKNFNFDQLYTEIFQAIEMEALEITK